MVDGGLTKTGSGEMVETLARKDEFLGGGVEGLQGLCDLDGVFFVVM